MHVKRDLDRADKYLLAYFAVLGVIATTIFVFRPWFLAHPLLHNALSGGYTAVLTGGAWARESGYNIAVLAAIGALGSFKGTPAFYLAGMVWGREYIKTQFGESRIVQKVTELIDKAPNWLLIVLVTVGHIPGLNIVTVPVNVIAGVKRVSLLAISAGNLTGLFLVNLGLTWLGREYGEPILSLSHTVQRYALIFTGVFAGIAVLSLVVRRLSRRRPSL